MDKRRNIFFLHTPLALSILSSLLITGVIYYLTRISDSFLVTYLPTLILRYLRDNICLLIVFVFILIVVYSFIQFAGLWADLQQFNEILNPEARFDWRVLFTNVVTGRSTHQHHPLNLFLQMVSRRTSYRHDNTGVLDTFLRIHAESLLDDLYLLDFGTWVLPLLGFIGTVWGVTKAITGLRGLTSLAHGSLQAAQSMSTGMTTVLDGLSTAFDTTLLGLSFVIPTMALNIFLRRRISKQLTNFHFALMGAGEVDTAPFPDSEDATT